MMRKAAGRPTEFSDGIAEAICLRLTEGESLRTICKDEDMPGRSTVFDWLANPDRSEFRTKYALAREAQADLLIDEIREIADDGRNDTYPAGEDEGDVERVNYDHIARSKLRVEARKWMAEKLAPKKYGPKMLLGEDRDNPLPRSEDISATAARVAAIMELARQRQVSDEG